VKAISEQMEALAVDLRDRGISYDRIAGEVGLTPVEARRIVARARRKRGWQGRYPDLAPLPQRAATALMRLGVYTRAEAKRLLLSGRACRYPGVGSRVIRDLCAWCELNLIEVKQCSYCVEGQADYEELIQDLKEKIGLAEANLKVWKAMLADLEFRTGTAPDGKNYDEERDRDRQP
jgi:hypothetical protein